MYLGNRKETQTGVEGLMNDCKNVNGKWLSVDFREDFPFLSDLCFNFGAAADKAESPFNCEGGSEVRAIEE
ncbi:UNVERIFIED_CONTAM: hypothetical protein K2H54_016571 [Gekko kuhli]